MKNKLLYSFLFVSCLMLSSCDDDSTEGVTRITYYPTISLLGEESVVLNLGDDFVDEGCTSILNGEDVSDKVVVTSTIDKNRIGIYNVNYNSYNVDGFCASASRKVYVVDPNAIATIYYGESKFGTRHYTGAPIFITDNSDGTYHLDDLVGGYQFYGRNPGFEPTYDFHAECNLRIESDNTVTQVGKTGSWYFSDSPTLVDGTFDPTTRTFNLNIELAGSPMEVTLKAVTK